MVPVADHPTGAPPFLCDVSAPDQLAATIPVVLADGRRIDALVNNAGAADFGPMAGWRQRASACPPGAAAAAD